MALNIVPNSGETLNHSRAPIAGNFVTINAAFKIDHVEYVLGNQGMHNTVTFPINAVPTQLTAGFIGLYGANDFAGKAQIFVNPTLSTTSTPAVVQSPSLTGGSLTANGWAYLPCGLLMKWGTGTTNSVTSFPAGPTIPVFKVAFSVQLTLVTAAALHYWIQLTTGTLNTTGFKAHSEDGNGNPSAQTFLYLAIGY